MSDLPHQEHRPIAQVLKDDERTSGITRRTVLAGAAAATAAATLGVVDTPASAHSLDPNSSEDMILFVLLSAALTGIAEPKLAPGFGPKQRMKPDELRTFMKNLKLSDFLALDVGSDPINIKSEYFNWVNDRRPAAFENLLRLARDSLDAPDHAEAIIAKLQFEEAPPKNDDSTKTGEPAKTDVPKRSPSEIDVKYLARSIVLMWYLGAWYDPDDLQKSSHDPSSTPNFQVISPKAYTQGWALKVAQAHPMGFSEMQFGYWTHPPNSRADFIE